MEKLRLEKGFSFSELFLYTVKERINWLSSSGSALESDLDRKS